MGSQSAAPLCALWLLLVASTAGASDVGASTSFGSRRLLSNGTASGGDDEVVAAIAHGWVPARTRFPYIAALITANGGFICGGSLITKRLVLTAAHCVVGGNPPTAVLVGLYNWNTDKSNQYQQIGIKRILRHPSYKGSTLAYDIAVLRLASRAKAKPLALAPAGKRLSAGISLLVAGWGETEAVPVSPQLKAAWLPLQPTGVCARRMWMPPTAICLGNGALKRAGCSGDSGSPIILYTPGKPDLQVGLYSFMPADYKCGGTGNLGAATSTIKLRRWLNSAIKQLGA